MAKNTPVTQHEAVEDDFEDFDYFDDMDESCDDGMADMMNCLIGASRDQMAAAIDLTTLVIDANGADSMNEDQVFAIFKRASTVIAENSPLNELLNQFGG